MNSTSNTTSNNHYPIASLYVGDLANDVTEAVLFEKFTTVGPVLSIRVCRDIITRRSLGYAYVNYQNAHDAETAIDTLNFERLNGRPIRIMWSQRDPSLRRSGVGNIFIKNLEKTVDNKVLFDTFSIFGNILSCKISYDEKGQSKGYGFVHFDSEETAQAAIVSLNGKNVKGKKVYVGKFIARKEREHKLGTPRRFTNVYVKNLSDEYDDDEKLRALFEPFGAITSAVVMTDEEKKSKGFGFVCFATTEAAEAAVTALNGKDMGGGKTLYVGRAQKKSEREAELKRRLEMLKMERINRSQGVNLYVKNLEDSITDERLQKEFSAFGTITSAKVMTDEKGRSKGFGFVCFSTPEEATKAVTEMNNRIIDSKPLYVALAQRKEDREAQKLNLRFGAPTGVRMPHQMQPNPGAHPQHLGAHLQFQNPAAALTALTTGMQGQPVQGAQQTPHPYLLPIAPNAQMHRGFYQPNGPAGVQGGAQPGIRMARWQNVGNIPRQPVGQYGQAGFRGMAPRGAPPAHVARGGAPGQPGQPQGPRQYIPGQNIAPAVPRGPRPQGGPGVRGGKPAGVVINPGGQPLPQVQSIAEVLAHTSPEEQTQILGERLYPLVHELQPELASKITGMFIEMEITEIIHMIDNPESLKAKVDEALAVLQAHRAKEIAAGKKE